MDNLFELNDMVMYGSHGVCTLAEIAERDFSGENRSYYVLHPAYSGSSTFYVPVDSEVLVSKMRHIKSASEIRKLIDDCMGESNDWIEDDRMRQSKLKQVVDGGGTKMLVHAMKALYEQQKMLCEKGRKLRAADDRFMKDMEKLLLEEFSVAFDIEREELIPFLYSEAVPSEKE